MAYLTIRIKDIDGHTTQELEGKRLVLGRSSSTDIPIKHSSISREQCAFVSEGDTWYLEDLGSANGSRLNGVKITDRVALNEKDIIKVGKARLTFHAKRKKSRTIGPDDGPVGVALDDISAASVAPVRTVMPEDPKDAVPCSGCGTWISVAHRLPGDRMDCPRCERGILVPTFAYADESALEAKATEEDDVLNLD